VEHDPRKLYGLGDDITTAWLGRDEQLGRRSRLL